MDGWCWVYGFRVVTDVRTDVKHRPIMFKAPMVRAILEGRKTQTRRPAEVPIWAKRCGISAFTPSGQVSARGQHPEHGPAEKFLRSPFGQAGDRLWVRETWAWNDPEMEEADRADSVGRPRSPGGRWAWYRATDGEIDGPDGASPWHPSIHMPRWASRLTLEVVSVRVERVEAISGEDAVAEGIQPFIGGPWGTYYAVAAEDEPHATAQAAFLGLWRSMYGS